MPLNPESLYADSNNFLIFLLSSSVYQFSSLTVRLDLGINRSSLRRLNEIRTRGLVRDDNLTTSDARY